jgi:hypothetical protein
MLNTTNDIITEVLVRNNRTTTDSFITDSTIQGWLKDAHTWAASYKKWPFTEGRYSTTASSTSTSPEGYTRLAYPESFKADSVRLMTVDGKRFEKKNFYKFQEFVEDNSGDDDLIYTDYGRELLINPNASGFSGTVVLWGQYSPILDVTDLSAKTIFSDYDEEGNEALVEKMTAYLKRREHLPDEAELHDQRAQAVLEAIYTRFADEQFAYHDTGGDGMFKRFDVVNGGFREDVYNTDRWNN